MNFERIVNENKAITFVRLTGKITRETSAEMIENVRKSLGQIRCSFAMLCDMTDVVHVDSNGVGAILQLHQAFENDRGVIVLHSMAPHVSGIFDILNLDRILNICDDATTAERKITALRS